MTSRSKEPRESPCEIMVSVEAQRWIDHILERSYVRHVLARHIHTNDPRIPELRRKHEM